MRVPWRLPVVLPHLREDEVMVRVETKDRWGRVVAVEEIWKVGEKMTVEVRRPT